MIVLNLILIVVVMFGILKMVKGFNALIDDLNMILDLLHEFKRKF